MTSSDLGELTREVYELKDLFVRRLFEDRQKQQLIDGLGRRLEQAEGGLFRQYLEPLVHEIALLIDRIDGYAGADPEFAASVSGELLEILTRYGVREVSCTGAFDPACHEVVATIVDETLPVRTIVGRRARGYAHGEWVFRPARVVVSSANSDEPGPRPVTEDPG